MWVCGNGCGCQWVGMGCKRVARVGGDGCVCVFQPVYVACKK